MKIKKFLIAGSIFLIIGIILTIISVSYVGINESSYEKKLVLSENTYETTDITKLNLKVNADTVTLISEDRSDLYIQNKELEDMTYTIEKNGNSINITQNNESIISSFFSLSWVRNKVFTKTPLIIKIPSSLELDYSIEINGGSINIDNLQGKNVDLDVNAGSISINDLTSSNLQVNLSAGSLKIQNVTSSLIDVRVSAGSASLNNVDASDVSVKLSAGSCKYEGVIKETGDFSVSAGSLSITLTDGRENYTVNGSGDGKAIITTSKSAGSLSITYK